MKNKKWIVMGMLCGSLVFVGGCGSKDEVKVPETERVMETQGDEVEIEETRENKAVIETQENDTIEEPETSPETEESKEGEVITVYAPDSMGEGLENKEVMIDEVTAEAVLSAILEEINFPDTVRLNSFMQDQSIWNLDLNQEFLDYLRANSGSSTEYLYIGCIVNTFLEAFGGDEIMITIDGEIMETGHTDYPSPMGRFEQ